MDGPRDTAVVAAVVEELTGIFRPLHVETRSEVTELKATVAELRVTVTDLSGTVASLVNTVVELSKRVAEIEEPARYAIQLGMAMGAEAGTDVALPADLTVPRTWGPSAIDRACAAAGTPDAHPAIIPQQHGNLVIHPKSGFSSTQVYDDVVQSIEDARSTSAQGGSHETTGLRRSRRTKKR